MGIVRTCTKLKETSEIEEQRKSVRTGEKFKGKLAKWVNKLASKLSELS